MRPIQRRLIVYGLAAAMAASSITPAFAIQRKYPMAERIIKPPAPKAQLSVAVTFYAPTNYGRGDWEIVIPAGTKAASALMCQYVNSRPVATTVKPVFTTSEKAVLRAYYYSATVLAEVDPASIVGGGSYPVNIMVKTEGITHAHDLMTGKAKYWKVPLGGMAKVNDPRAVAQAKKERAFPEQVRATKEAERLAEAARNTERRVREQGNVAAEQESKGIVWAKKATGEVTFYRGSEKGDIVIPNGTRTSTKMGEMRYVRGVITTEYAVLPAGSSSVTVPVEAYFYGKSENVPAGKIKVLSIPIKGIKGVRNAKAITGGVSGRIPEPKRNFIENIFFVLGAVLQGVSTLIVYAVAGILTIAWKVTYFICGILAKILFR